jgi:hypothetical protein
VGPQTRASAAAALSCLCPDDPAALSILDATLVGEERWSRSAALRALAEFARPEASAALVPRLTAVLRDHAWIESQEEAVARALGRIGVAALGPVLALLRAGDLPVHYGVVASLGYIGPAAREAVPLLLDVLARKDQYELLVPPPGHSGLYFPRRTANRAIAALRRIVGPEDREAVTALVTALRWEDDWVRQAAAEGLGQIGPAGREALPALRIALEDRVQAVREAAGCAIRQIER